MINDINEHVQYELFVKQLYEEILSEEGFHNIDVKHNVKVRGKFGQMHQIDIYWEFQIAGMNYKTAIECKNYKNPVSKDKISAFYGILEDIGDIKGIFVSLNGYQSGAKEYAENHGIILKEARLPKENDWDGFIKAIDINTVFICPLYNLNVAVQIDFNDCFHRKVYNTIEEAQNASIFHTSSINELQLYDSNREPIGTILSFVHFFQGSNGRLSNVFPHSILSQGWHIIDKNDKLLKIKGLSCEFTLFKENIIKKSFTVDYGLMVKAILKDIQTGDVRFFNK